MDRQVAATHLPKLAAVDQSVLRAKALLATGSLETEAWGEEFDKWRRDAIEIVNGAFSRAVAEEFRRAVSTPGRRRDHGASVTPERRALQNGSEMLVTLREGEASRNRHREAEFRDAGRQRAQPPTGRNSKETMT